MKRILSAIVVASVIVSCGTNKEKEQAATTTSLPRPIVVPSTNYSPLSGTVPVNNPNTQSNPVIVTSTPAPTPGTTAAGMNPAHGQPGHRCDIPVGAPLNSAPTTPTSTTTTLPNNKTMTVSQPVITTTGSNPPSLNFNPAQAQTKTVTAPGMNPPHGEPGHRCDISVGAPLNSKPTVAAATAPTTPTIQTISTPPVIKSQQAPAKDSSK